MTVSRAFWKIVAKNIGVIITYTIILIMFGSLNMSSDSTTQFEARKPSIVIFNHDEERGVTKSFLHYLENNAEVSNKYEDDDKLNDALFYEKVALVVDIPENFSQEFALGKNPEIKTRSSSGYIAELAKVLVRRYLSTAKAYTSMNLSEEELSAKVDKILSTTTEVDVKTTVDTTKYSRATRYFDFANYSILACVITVICLIMTSFNRTEIRKRNLVSSIELKRMNRILLRNSCIYATALWCMYVALGFIVVGFSNLWSIHGVLYIVNSLLFCVCATTIAYLISNIVKGAGAVNGIMNVVALGSSFLCGAFVPVEYLPESVVAFAHVLPSYYYIDANNKIMAIEDYTLESLMPIIVNMAVVAAFCVLFVIISNVVARKKARIA